MGNYVYPLQNDLVFKAVFGRNTPESKEALIRMLNAILKEYHQDHIQQITHKNPYLEQSHVDEKVAILDIKAVTDQGEQINIEMQVGAQKGFRKRLLYYGAKLHGEQLYQGEVYDV
ncbi:MAG: Rpn family recombination-promoting nuclease/putative transposase, partial [Vallitaleaceae bacterium]|nr:Rpn family recombination-promoting nuclease/putative transposase [Vallitaleaceae bacterium]